MRSFKLGKAAEEEAAENAKAAGAADVAGIVAANDVVLFVSSTCPYCQQAKTALAEANIPFKEVEVDSALKQDLLDATGQTSVPSGWVKGAYIGGCNDGPEPWMGIVPCINSGKIKEMMA